MPKIDKERIVDIVLLNLGIFCKNGYPGRIKVKQDSILQEGIIYKPVLKFNPIITLDEDESIGTCVCSICNSHVEPWDKYCSHCGAKSNGTIVRSVNDDDQ